jgi:TonB family protein
LGHHYVREARWEEAAKWYRASLEIEPRDIVVLHNLGVCYSNLGQIDQALEEFERALAVDPSYTKTLLSKGIALASGKNDVAGAKTAWERVVSLAPGTAEGDAARQALEGMQRELQRVPPPSSRLVADAARPSDAGVIAPRVESELAAVYSTQALQAGVEGEVWLECVVLADGTVGSVAVVRSLHPDLDLNAIAAAQRWRFKPGTKKGVPVPVLVTISMSFSIRK